jgi:hypothetical protein
MNVINLQEAREARAQAAFQAYVAAKQLADRTLLIADMAEAVRTWNRFIELAIDAVQDRRGLSV